MKLVKWGRAPDGLMDVVDTPVYGSFRDEFPEAWTATVYVMRKIMDQRDERNRFWNGSAQDDTFSVKSCGRVFADVRP